MNIITDTNDFIKQPFKSDMNLTGWLLFIGLIMIVTLLWSHVIKLIVES